MGVKRSAAVLAFLNSCSNLLNGYCNSATLQTSCCGTPLDYFNHRLCKYVHNDQTTENYAVTSKEYILTNKYATAIPPDSC